MMTRMSIAPAAERPITDLAEYAPVVLTREVMAGGTVFPSGTAGVIVHCHRDGVGYEVEFTRPVFRVLTLTADDLTRA